jgi:hypothetical protein
MLVLIHVVSYRGRPLTRVELRVCEELNIMFAVARDNVVALQMQRDIAERVGVAVNIQRPHVTNTSAVLMELVAEEMREI